MLFGVYSNTEAMTLETPISMEALYRKLARTGLDRKFVREVLLPEWWDDAIADSPAGLAEAELRIARALGIRWSELREGALSESVCIENLLYAEPVQAHDKPLRWTVCLAKRVAELGLHATPLPYQPPDASAQEVRQALMKQRCSDTIELDALVDYCWKHGIPVLHLGRIPSKNHFAGVLVPIVHQRPAIVVGSREGTPQILPIIARALGYIAASDAEKACTFAQELLANSSPQAASDELHTILRAMNEHLDWQRLTEEEAELLKRLTGG